MTPEEYITAYTRSCSNELVGGGYQRWLPVEDALAAVKLVREEMKEPVSKDLSDLIDKLSKRYIEVSFAKLVRIVVAATKWQKSQDQHTIELAEEHALLAGMMQERERMMKDAVDGWVARDKDGDIAIFREAPTKDAEIGMWKPCKSAYIFPSKDEYPDVTWDSEPQKVKVIIIKE